MALVHCAGCENRHKRSAIDIQCRMIHGRGDRKARKIHNSAGGKHGFAFQEILSARAYVLPLAQGVAGFDAIAIQPYGVFLQENRIGARGNGSTGENANRFAFADATIEGVASGRGADDLQRRTRHCRIIEAQRVTIHRRSVERRLCQAGRQIFSQNPAFGHIEWNAFNTMDRRCTVQ
jgi:hypothetical protein